MKNKVTSRVMARRIRKALLTINLHAPGTELGDRMAIMKRTKNGEQNLGGRCASNMEETIREVLETQ